MTPPIPTLHGPDLSLRRVKVNGNFWTDDEKVGKDSLQVNGDLWGRISGALIQGVLENQMNFSGCLRIII